ncbi:mannonate dehydratase [Actinocrispum wychmicini]|uniref:mannonate dehydratase n=1 Tax=Actinocrispum wychmicini TaxID=1213861 RepID=A0A4R2J9A8_9PSEU|nr:mannonate dehydratase [Actinocrispum wychmicini]TCO55893.1 mannonate dehydratase [Actinocrispum wychmicini]
MRLALGHIDEFDERVARFAQQLGLRSVQFHAPANLPGTDGYWTVDELVALRTQCDEYGLRVEGLENVPAHHWDSVVRGEPGRDEQLDNYCRTIRGMAEAGIFVLGHHFMATYVWRTELTAPGRGGALVTRFDLADAERGNALAAYKLVPPRPLAEPITAEQMWANYATFLEAVLPVAEQAGVRLVLHPDDPPVDVPLGGAARIFTSPAALARAAELAGDSPAWGLNLCLGTVSEMTGGQAAVEEVIDHFGPRIASVHFRDVRGTVPNFQEAFLGEGNFRPAAVLRRLADVGFDGFVIDDHVPVLDGDAGPWTGTDPDTYCSRGRAHAIGYLQGLFEALNLTDR